MVNGGLPRTVKIERTIRYRLDLQIICANKKIRRRKLRRIIMC
jgi:hypothetical protein